MINRLIKNEIEKVLASYPAVLLQGARQVGKTTLAKNLGGSYFDLENDQDILRLDIEWEKLIAQEQLVVLDECQRVPALFTRLRSAIDAQRQRNGRFLLLGSVAPALMRHAGDALTGRLALCELGGFLLQEIPADRASDLWLYGGYPQGSWLQQPQFPRWQSYYLDLLAQRDLPDWGLPATPAVTKRFFHMLAALNGQTWNASQLGKSLGISYHSVNNYLDFLENAFLLRRLQPYSANIKKRLVKACKIYWRDSGLLHSLLSWSPETDIYNQPWVGASWEGWVIEQILGTLAARGYQSPAYFLRTSDKHEIDLLLEHRGQLWALEIKLTSIPSPGDMDRLRQNAALIGADQIVLLSRTNQTASSAKEHSLNLAAALQLLIS